MPAAGTAIISTGRRSTVASTNASRIPAAGCSAPPTSYPHSSQREQTVQSTSLEVLVACDQRTRRARRAEGMRPDIVERVAPLAASGQCRGVSTGVGSRPSRQVEFGPLRGVLGMEVGIRPPRSLRRSGRRGTAGSRCAPPNRAPAAAEYRQPIATEPACGFPPRTAHQSKGWEPASHGRDSVGPPTEGMGLT